MRVAWLLAVVVVVSVVGVVGCGKSKSAAPAGPVGKVAVVVGEVQATRAGQAARKLEVDAEVFGDDVIKTGVGARVELALVGGVRYEIGAEAQRNLGQQLALLKGAGAGSAADVTAAAGRHGEEEAAATEATAETGGGGAVKGSDQGSGAQGGGSGSGAPEATAALPPPGAAPRMAAEPPPPIQPDPARPQPAPQARNARESEAASAEEIAQAEAKQRELDELMAMEERMAVLKREQVETTAKASKDTKTEATAPRDAPDEPIRLACAPDDPLCSVKGSRQPKAATIPPPSEQLSAQEVKGVVLPALPELRRCGAASFKADKTLTALTVKINMEIAPTGKVSSATVAEASAAPKYDACVIAKAKKLKFPRATQTTKLRLPVAARP